MWGGLGRLSVQALTDVAESSEFMLKFIERQRCLQPVLFQNTIHILLIIIYLFLVLLHLYDWNDVVGDGWPCVTWDRAHTFLPRMEGIISLQAYRDSGHQTIQWISNKHCWDLAVTMPSLIRWACHTSEKIIKIRKLRPKHGRHRKVET